MDEANEKFKAEFTAFVHDYCGGSHNSYTLDLKKRDRVLKCLRDAKEEPSARFRFWVRAKGFRIVQSADGDDILAVPPKGNDPSDMLFKRVATIEEFFDIVYAAHSENGHVGQAQTFRAIRAMYALVPRIVVIKFIEMCPQCSKSQHNKRFASQSGSNIISADKLAGSFAVQKREPEVEEGGFEEAVDNDVTNNQQEVTNALQEILSAKIASGEMDGVVQIESTDPSLDTPATVFSCHLCTEQFPKRKALQQHIQSHQDFRPAVPLQRGAGFGGSASKRRKLNIGFSSPYSGKPRKSTMARRRMILDVDSSITAAQAIMLAASRPDIELMAINCVAGRVSVLNACENALRVLKACGREDIHVCRGAEKSLLGHLSREGNLPGAAWSQKVDGQIQAEHSVSSLIRCINENPGEITLVCLGPLTNLALALRLDPLVADHLKDVYIVGGNVEGQGDLSSCAEQNFLHDPEAAHIVLQEIKNAHILPYEVSERHKIPFDHFVACLNAGTEKSVFLIDSMTQEELQHRTNGVVSPDVFAVAMVIDPTIVLEKEKVFVTVELKGEYSRGLMVVDRRGFMGKPHNAFVVKNMDLSKTQALFGVVFSGQDVNDGCLPVTTVAPTREHSVPILYREVRLPVV
ncbi:uncharacterized protein LOC101862785 [Aplysia californica]|uniref:Uncharacterized protein LOC101862785 n=1 Tax=Aplysia californica TaxID=6500 RepID=A0ABM0JHC6_APLCA|nr:uncharacterized protein LOC101862785 [Aplysia californica]